jgi:hypothetical protein
MIFCDLFVQISTKYPIKKSVGKGRNPTLFGQPLNPEGQEGLLLAIQFFVTVKGTRSSLGEINRLSQVHLQGFDDFVPDENPLFKGQMNFCPWIDKQVFVYRFYCPDLRSYANRFRLIYHYRLWGASR